MAAGWGESRGDPGGTGDAAAARECGDGEQERDSAGWSSVGEARGEQPGVERGDSSAMS